MQTLLITETPVDLEAQSLSFLPGATVVALNATTGGVVILSSDTNPGTWTPVAGVDASAAEMMELPTQRFIKTFAGPLIFLAL
jgi:hypothetical protein